MFCDALKNLNPASDNAAPPAPKLKEEPRGDASSPVSPNEGSSGADSGADSGSESSGRGSSGGSSEVAHSGDESSSAATIPEEASSATSKRVRMET